MLSRMRILIGAVLLAAVVATGERAQAGIIDVDIQGFTFNGPHLTIRLGDTVRWRNLDTTVHTVTEGTDTVITASDAFHHPFPSASQNPPPFEVTFDATFLAAFPRAGNVYRYLCIPHSGSMRGSITVDTGPGTPGCFCYPDAPCLGVNVDAGAGCPNAASVFRGARLLGAGSASLTADDLVLNVDTLPAGALTILLRSQGSSAPLPFLDGYSCLSATFVRAGRVTSSAGGLVSFGPGLAAASQATYAPFSAGQTWTFQAWYRELPAPFNCGMGGNISNSYEVPFAP